MLHIVHPYTFKLKGRSLLIEPVEEHRERNCKLARLVKTALAYRYPVFAHERITGGINTAIEAAALKSDYLFEPLFRPRVTWFGTDEYGKPIGGLKPGDVPEEVWAYRLEHTVTPAELVDLVGDPEEILVCGGEFTRCEGNFMEYMSGHFKELERKLYIPELSVTIPEDRHMIAETAGDLKELGFKPISCEEAMEMIKNPLNIPH